MSTPTTRGGIRKAWMTEELLMKLLFSLRWYVNRWGDRDGMLFAGITGTGFGSHGALDAVSVKGRDAWKDLRPALEGLVALGLVMKRPLGKEWRRAPLYRWALTPAGFQVRGIGSAVMTAEQLASLDEALVFHRDDMKRRAERILERQAERESCAVTA